MSTRRWKTADAPLPRCRAEQNDFQEGEAVWISWHPADERRIRVAAVAFIAFLLPARIWMALFFRCAAGDCVRLQSADAGRLRRRGTAVDTGEFHPPWPIRSISRSSGVLSGSPAWLPRLCALLGFPLALFIARAGRRSNLYLQLVLLPFWTSFLVRTYAWIFILRDTGLINTALTSLGADRQASAAAL